MMAEVSEGSTACVQASVVKHSTWTPTQRLKVLDLPFSVNIRGGTTKTEEKLWQTSVSQVEQGIWGWAFTCKTTVANRNYHIKQAVVYVGALAHIMHLATAELCHIFQWPEACENSASRQSSYQHCRRSHNRRFTGRPPESVSPLQYLTKCEICSPSLLLFFRYTQRLVFFILSCRHLIRHLSLFAVLNKSTHSQDVSNKTFASSYFT